MAICGWTIVVVDVQIYMISRLNGWANAKSFGVSSIPERSASPLTMRRGDYVAARKIESNA